MKQSEQTLNDKNKKKMNTTVFSGKSSSLELAKTFISVVFDLKTNILFSFKIGAVSPL
jgi:hypothetical protein